MEVKDHFIRVTAPTSQSQISPRPMNTYESPRNRELVEAKVGNYLVKA
jgi:hypothetical protein